MIRLDDGRSNLVAEIMEQSLNAPVLGFFPAEPCAYERVEVVQLLRAKSRPVATFTRWNIPSLRDYLLQFFSSSLFIPDVCEYMSQSKNGNASEGIFAEQ
jgi:hypothetical protein